MHAALVDEVVGDGLGEPRQLAQAWMDLFVERADTLLEEGSLLKGQGSNDPVANRTTYPLHATQTSYTPVTKTDSHPAE